MSNCQFILTAALLYFLLASLNSLLIVPILSKESPLYNRSSKFFDMIWVVSFNWACTLSKFPEALGFSYDFFVLCMNVSKSLKA